MENKDPRNWALACHLSALSMFIGMPFGNLLGPLIVWLIKRDEMPMVDEHGKEALNFQISMMIYGIISFFLCIVIIGFFLLFILMVLNVVFIVKASIMCNKEQSYRYPMTIRFIK